MSAAPVAVVGAGWAGLAAAVTLAAAGRPVRVFEAAPQAGGRARTAPALGLEVDNGQHLAIGAYTAVLGLLDRLGIAESAVFARLPLHLEQRDANGVRFLMQAPVGAGPATTAWAFLRAQGLTVGDKLALLAGWRRLLPAPPRATTVAAWFQATRQPRAAVTLLWEPLCIATLNTPLLAASARVFHRVLKEAFDSGAPGTADLLLPARALGAVLPEPALQWLAARGSELHLGERVTQLTLSPAVTRVETAKGAYAVAGAVLAVPPDACARLLEPHAAHQALVKDCNALETQPICTIYLRVPETAALPSPLVGLTGTTTQWVVDRRVAGQPGVLAAIISADGPHMALDNDALIALVTEELCACLPGLAPPTDARVIREKRATFAATPSSESLRPAMKTATPGLVLAGDWTDTGLPATLEGAVRSGTAAAHQLLQELQ